MTDQEVTDQEVKDWFGQCQELTKLLEKAQEENVRWRRICCIYDSALRQIKGRMGGVCPEFETCTHAACADSSSAYLVASQALEEAGWKFGMI